MTDLWVRFKKKTNGEATLTCQRQDGTVTGQRSTGFFVPHDLGHYAIETTLGLRSAFYGMLARGWDFDDFGSPWPRGPFPSDAGPDLSLAEQCAGLLDLVRAGVMGSEEELNAWFEQPTPPNDPMAPPRITAAQFAQIRATYQALWARWEALPPGETLELPFPIASNP